MTRRLLARSASALTAIVAASRVAFGIRRLSPGDPVGLVLGPFATDAARSQLSAEMGLNQSVPHQYLDYVAGLVRGDWGYSYSTGVPVRELMSQRLAASVELSLAAALVAVTGAAFLAVLRASTRSTRLRRAVDGFFIGSLAVPQFWLGLLLLLVLAQSARVLPGPEGRLSPEIAPPPRVTGLYTVDSLMTAQWSTFLDAGAHLILPAVALGTYMLGFLGRLLARAMQDDAVSPFVLASRARGMGVAAANYRHGLPNAALAVAPAVATTVGLLLTGGVLVEGVFAWPGIGAAVTDSIRKQDYALVQAFVVFSATIFVICTLICDLLVSIVDPRTRSDRPPAPDPAASGPLR